MGNDLGTLLPIGFRFNAVWFWVLGVLTALTVVVARSLVSGGIVIELL